MIDTKFEAYCEECTELDPIVNKVYADNKIVSQIITCNYIERCKRIYAVIEMKETIRRRNHDMER